MLYKDSGITFKDSGITFIMIQTTLDSFAQPGPSNERGNAGENAEVLCQPCDEFTKKGKRWYCFCNKQVDKCISPICKEYGLKEHNIKVGGSMCKHERQKYSCKDCNGSGICKHKRHKQVCKECNGAEICEHGTRRSRCKKCGGGSICLHDKRIDFCPECNPVGNAYHNRISRRRKAIIAAERAKAKSTADEDCAIALNHTLEDLCMTCVEWLNYLNKTFEDRYGRPKTVDDKVEIDEIIPCSGWNLPSDNKYCWHYMNSQWLLSRDNSSKSNSYTEEDKLAMIERIEDYFTS